MDEVEFIISLLGYKSMACYTILSCILKVVA